MIVRRIKQYLAACGEATFSEIIAETGENRDMVAAAIHFWVKRGDMELITDCYEPGGTGCSVNCKGCPVSHATLSGNALRVPDSGSASRAVYRWVAAGEAGNRPPEAVAAAGGTPGRRRD